MNDTSHRGPANDELNQVTLDMKSIGLELTKESDLSNFLGVNIDITLTAPFT